MLVKEKDTLQSPKSAERDRGSDTMQEEGQRPGESKMMQVRNKILGRTMSYRESTRYPKRGKE